MNDCRGSRMSTRFLIVFVVVGLAVVLSGCSVKSDFVIVNESANPIEVRYKVKDHPGPFYPLIPPSSMRATDLSSKGNNDWSTLPPSGVQLDETQRTVTVTVKPHEALLITSITNYFSHDNELDAQRFAIEEINVSGSHGELTLVGDQARRSFSKMSVALYTFTYK